MLFETILGPSKNLKGFSSTSTLKKLQATQNDENKQIISCFFQTCAAKVKAVINDLVSYVGVSEKKTAHL